MNKTELIKDTSSINILPIEKCDINKYFIAIKEMDEEAKYYTNTLLDFTFSQIEEYVLKIEKSNSRNLFLIILGNEYLGEVALSDISDKSCHFRICIYKKENFSKGYGNFALNWIIQYAFSTLNLSEIELEVYPFNKRAINLYEKFGFKETHRIFDNSNSKPYDEIITMLLKK